MAKGKASSNSKARVKAPPKKTAPSTRKNTKTLPPQHNSKGKGSRKRAANDLDVTSSGGESSGEEPDPRPKKKHRGKQKETSDEDEDGDEHDDDEVIEVDKAGLQSDSEV
jgi:hypothetical protein